MKGPLKVLVTGAAGRLGRVVASRFYDSGHDVLATDIAELPEPPPHRFERADLLDHESASALLNGIDVLLHIGNLPGLGSTPPQLVFNQNISINANMFQGAAEQGVPRIVFASTLQLIGSHLDSRTVVTPAAVPTYPMDGSTPADPSNLYALSKSVSETMLSYFATRCGVDAVALRFPLLHDGGDFIFTVVNTLDDLEDDPQMQANGYVTEIPHPQFGTLKYMNCPVGLSETPGAVREPAPELGQHTELLLTEELGYTWDDIGRLKGDGVI